MSDTPTNGIDFNEIESLFTVVEKCVTHSGKYASIMGLAMTRLGEIDAQAKTIREEQAKAEAEAAARDQEANRPKAIPSSDLDQPEPAETNGNAPTLADRRI